MAPIRIRWLPASCAASKRQSKAATAQRSSGAPVRPVSHRSACRPSSRVRVGWRPAKRSASSAWLSASKLTASSRLRQTAPATGLWRLMQARSMGGSAETELTALTVSPCRPAGPSVVTSQTELALRLIASIKAQRSASSKLGRAGRVPAVGVAMRSMVARPDAGLLIDSGQHEPVFDQPVQLELADHAVVRQLRTLDVFDPVTTAVVARNLVRADAEGRRVQHGVILDRVDELNRAAPGQLVNFGDVTQPHRQRQGHQ